MKEHLNRMEQQWWNFLNKKFHIGWVFLVLTLGITTCLYILIKLL